MLERAGGLDCYDTLHRYLVLLRIPSWQYTDTAMGAVALPHLTPSHSGLREPQPILSNTYLHPQFFRRETPNSEAGRPPTPFISRNQTPSSTHHVNQESSAAGANHLARFNLSSLESKRDDSLRFSLFKPRPRAATVPTVVTPKAPSMNASACGTVFGVGNARCGCGGAINV